MTRTRTLIHGSALAAAAAVSLSAGVPDAAGDHDPPGSYEFRLESRWPQYGAGTDCRNGGSEELSGTLARAGDEYRGSLTRSAVVLFCGDHGGSGGVCQLELRVRDRVGAVAIPSPSGAGSGPALLRWRGSADQAAAAGREVRVDGDCPPAFGARVRDMYLSATRSTELALPEPGSGGTHLVLNDYGWEARVR